MINYYPPIKLELLSEYMEAYMQLVRYTLKIFKIDSIEYKLAGDHIGIQVLSSEEFDLLNNEILSYANILRAGSIHNRRNNIYRFVNQFHVNGFDFKGIEIFEPKPNADLSKLKPGVEHVAFYTPRYEDLRTCLIDNNVPIDKEVDMDGSKFLKTKFVNLVEIEFRNDFLGDTE